MKISVFGTGYVGLVAAACFADKGCLVTCVDVNEQKIQMLRDGEVPIYEPRLKEVLHDNKERLVYTTDASVGVANSTVIFLAVGTPQKKDSFEADLEYLESAAIKIAQLMKQPKIIVIKSTVPVGSSKHILDLMRKHTNIPISIVSNPEFLKEGDAIRDFEYPERIIIGCEDDETFSVMQELYSPFVRKSESLLRMDNASAELSKYGSNIMLAARISVMNELARIAQATGADIMAVKRGVGTDSRIGSAFLYPGPGYGGSCFPKDVREMTALAKRLKVPLTIIPAIDSTNEQQKDLFAKRAIAAVSEHKGSQVAVWGAAFKPRTDDIRESAALTVIDALLNAGLKISLYDPEATVHVKAKYGSRLDYASQYGSLEDADALIIMTDWNEFLTPDFARMKIAMKHPLIIDSRNLYAPSKMAAHGFTYLSVGRPSQ